MSVGPLEAAIRETVGTLPTSPILVKCLDTWSPEEKAKFLELYGHGRRADMRRMIEPLPAGTSNVMLDSTSEIMAEVLAEQLEVHA